MKKQTAMALAAVFAMSVAGTALAAPVNPFVDVPAKHWSYDSINQLAKAGVISGYGDGTFQGDKTLTRYEAATLVAKAMANADKLNPENKKALEALKTEFSAELNNLGVRVSNIESRLDNVKVKGDVRFRYDYERTTTGGVDTTAKNQMLVRSRVYFTGQVNDQWTFNARIQNVSDLRKNTTTSTDTNNVGFANGVSEDTKTEFNQGYISGKIFGGTYNIGRQDLFFMDGLLIDNTASSNFKGAIITYPINKGSVSAIFGSQDVAQKVSAAPLYMNLATTARVSALQANTKIGVVDFGAGYAKLDGINTNLNAGSNNYLVLPAGSKKDFSAWQATAGTKIGPEFYFGAAYAKSNQSQQNKAYTYKVSYKTFNYANPGSYSAWVQYRNMEALSTTNGFTSLSTYDVNNISSRGFKGYELGFVYAPWKNIEWKTWYSDGKTTTGTEVKDKFLASYLRVWF